MEIKFESIKLNNFCSFASAEVDLSDMGNILVTGRNHCKLDNAYSNGSGKSSIFNGICYALTGETSQGVTNGVENIFANPEDCWVELTFMADNDRFSLKRIKTPRPDLKIYINGEDKSGKGLRESAKLLATYLPDLTSELLSSIIILGQGLPHRFSNNKPAGRKEILEKLTKSDFMIQSIKDKLETRLSTLRLTLRATEDELLSNKTQLNVYKKQVAHLEATLSEFDQSSEDSIADQISRVEEAIKSNEAEQLHYNEVVATLTEQITKANTEKSEALINKNKELNLKLGDIESQIKIKDNKATELSTEIRLVEKEIKKLSAITDICPTCGQRIPEVKKPDVSAQVNHLQTLRDDFDKIAFEVDCLEGTRNQIISDHELAHKDTMTILNKTIVDLSDKLTTADNTVVALTTNIMSLKVKLTELNYQRDNYSKVIAEVGEATRLIDELTKAMTTIQSSIDTTQAHISVVQQMITLAKREFRGVLLANVIEFINKKVKQYAREVFGSDQLDFTLNENCIDITYCDKIYENLSGGEKQKIDIIIQLALRDILSRQLNIHSNLLILDEIYDNMDSISCQKITNLIAQLNDIDSIFIISHHAQDLEITYDAELTVEKNENGISSVSFTA